jgi:hypothetical protein
VLENCSDGLELVQLELGTGNMQQTSLTPTRSQSLSFSEFLTVLFESFAREGLRPCILRNYEGFPASNVGSDVDFFIHPSELPRAIRALQSIPSIRIVGYAERHYVAHLFVEGVSPEPSVRCLVLDFIWSLNWKGQAYLAADDVLQAAMPRQAGNLEFLVPSPVHEAIISLLSSLLIGGWLKEKYFSKVQRTFADSTAAVIAALSPAFGLAAATRLADAVLDGDRGKMLDCIKPLRIALVSRAMLHKPLRGLLSMTRYYAFEFAVRCTPRTIEAVCITSSDRTGKTSIIEELLPMLKYSAKLVERRHFGPRLPAPDQSRQSDAPASSRDECRSGSMALMVKIVRWLAREWVSQFLKRNNLTLRVSEGSCRGLFRGPEERRDGMPERFARLASKLLPSADLWILLDEAADQDRPASHPAQPAEVVRHPEAAGCFVKARSICMIPAADRPVASVTEDAYEAIIDVLAQRSIKRIRRRFHIVS